MLTDGKSDDPKSLKQTVENLKNDIKGTLLGPIFEKRFWSSSFVLEGCLKRLVSGKGDCHLRVALVKTIIVKLDYCREGRVFSSCRIEARGL